MEGRVQKWLYLFYEEYDQYLLIFKIHIFNEFRWKVQDLPVAENHYIGNAFS